MYKTALADILRRILALTGRRHLRRLLEAPYGRECSGAVDVCRGRTATHQEERGLADVQ